MNKLTATINSILQITDRVSSEENKKILIESAIRGYASSAINFVLEIETTALVGKQREERIQQLFKLYGIQESLMGQFY